MHFSLQYMKLTVSSFARTARAWVQDHVLGKCIKISTTETCCRLIHPVPLFASSLMHKLRKLGHAEILMFAEWGSPKLVLHISRVESEYATSTEAAHSRLMATWLYQEIPVLVNSYSWNTGIRTLDSSGKSLPLWFSSSICWVSGFESERQIATQDLVDHHFSVTAFYLCSYKFDAPHFRFMYIFLHLSHSFLLSNLVPAPWQ